jgi:uncharacterized membrane protein YedE/YeeE
MISATFRIGVGGAERAWRAAFLLGLVAGSLFATALLGHQLVERSPTSGPLLVLAGLAVGIGTGIANGCTSGHGVCGVSRLSPRSLAATAVFMAFGFLTASVLRHLFGA